MYKYINIHTRFVIMIIDVIDVYIISNFVTTRENMTEITMFLKLLLKVIYLNLAHYVLPVYRV